MTTNNFNRNSPGFWLNLFNSFRIAWKLLLDKRVPLLTKLIPFVVVIYILSPIDVIPDVIPVLGQLDDLAIFIIGVQIFIAVSPRHVVEQIRAEINGSPPPDGWTVSGSQPNDSNQSSGSSASKDIIDG